MEMEDINNLKATELSLRLPGSDDVPTVSKGNKRSISEVDEDNCNAHIRDSAPLAKTQVVGWPPVRAFRMNNIKAKKNDEVDDNCGIYVKVSMDGAPYLRKVDLKMYKGYKELRMALEGMFKCFSLGQHDSSEGYDDGSHEYVIAYEDKDGDWMLVGDVPWEMFIGSCKRLRIMKGSEAKGLSSS